MSTTQILYTDEQGDVKTAELSEKDLRAEDRLRMLLSEIYAFLRSQSLNRSYATRNLDHYLSEARDDLSKRRVLLDSFGSPAGTRPSRLERLEILEQAFKDLYPELKRRAEAKDRGDEV
jgi:hypothetical protein